MKRVYVLLIIFSFFFVNISYASHVIKLKITYPNSEDNCENNWCQVYVEIPAKLYIDKGWLRSDLENLRFNDGSRNLNYWVVPKKDNNLKVNKLGLWLLVYDLKPNSTKYIEMILDNRDSISYCNPLADSSVQSYDRVSYDCAASVFEFYSPNFDDWKWSKSPSSNAWYDTNTKFEENSLYTVPNVYPIRDGDDAKTGNEFILHIDNLKYYDPAGEYSSEIKIYFLSQAPYNSPNELRSKPGYRIYVKKASDFWNVSDDLHYSRRHFKIKLQEKEKGTTWVTKAVVDWYVYNNSRYVFDLRVSKDFISLFINGQHLSFTGRNGGTVDESGNFVRDDDLDGGYFGFNRLGWRLCCGTDVDYIFLRKLFKKDPVVTVYGSADLVVGQGSTDRGLNLTELVPDVQNIDVSQLGGNTLDKYIYATYDIASFNQTVNNLKVEFRNRYSTARDFKITQSKISNNPNDWVIYWCDSNGFNCELSPPSVINIDGGGKKEYTIKVIPSPSVLFNGGKLSILINQTDENNYTFDNGKFNINVNPKLACYWKWKLPISVSWDAAYGYDLLRDYQVLVDLKGISQLRDANVDGSDIIVTDSSGNIIPFWIKSFDRENGNLSLWVRLPKIPNGTSKFYIWWGNKNKRIPDSNIKKTFDLWEDWNNYSLGSVVGCPDGTEQCRNEGKDPDGWLNIATPDDFYNWWIIREKPNGNKIIQADIFRKGNAIDIHNGLCDYEDHSGKSCDTGPYLLGGKVAWSHYEVSYKMNAGSYCQYSGCGNPWGNPQYNPVFVIDAGNMWGMEFFADKFIFRPYASGIDYVWQYQTYPKNILGQSFPKKEEWYWVKIRVFKDKNTGRAYLKVLIADSTPSDIDNDSNFKVVGNFTAPSAFSLPYGKIGFGGWDSGFYFDNIRVRKYVLGSNGKEPQCSPSSGAIELNPRKNISLSQPQITPPYFSGREAYLVTETKPFSWLGDIKAYDAECYIGGSCKEGQNPDLLGTISFFGNIDDNNSDAKGLGYYLMEQMPSDRIIYTLDDNNINNLNNGFDNFNLNNCLNIKKAVGSSGTCKVNDNLSDETEKIIEFVRGKYVRDFPKSESRNMDMIYGNKNGIPEDNEQWKLGDILHSNPLIVGLPNMNYSIPSYQEWMNYIRYKARPLMLYVLSNDGMLHAFMIAYYNKNSNPPRYEVVRNPKELWGFIPNLVLHKLKNLVEGTGHEYSCDGLLRAIDVYDSSENTWKTVLFGLLGRGGGEMFAIDITDPTKPKLLWDINKYTNPVVFSKIGTTISSPAMGKIKINGEDLWVAIVGSGYDTNYINNYINKKAYLSLVDLLNGNVIKQIKVSNKLADVLTDIQPVRFANGYLNKIYFGDYYGVLWRLNVSNANGDLTQHFLELLNSSEPSLSQDDMLYKPVDYNLYQLPSDVKNPITADPEAAWDGSSWWIYFGTGDYTELDRNYDSKGNSIYPHQFFVGVKDQNSYTYTLESLDNMTDPEAPVIFGNGWFIELGYNSKYDVLKELSDNGSLVEAKDKNSNERVLQPPEIYSGIVYFTTYQPNDTPCGGGISRFYAVSYKNGKLKENLFGFNNQFKTARSVELSGRGVASKPMIYSGQGVSKAVAAGVVNRNGSLEKVQLNPSYFIKNITIKYWRVRK